METLNIFKCPKCESPIDGGNGYCRACYAAYKRHESTNPEARKKRIARSRAYKALKKGLIFKHNCALCHSEQSEMHHPDYNNPLDVIWLCEQCHTEIHVLERKALCA